jgi:hypothetical protein
MRYKPCDELAANLCEAENAHHICLDLETAERLIEYVCERYGQSDLFFEVLLDDALDSENLEEVLRSAYKMTLGRFFNTRAQFKRKEMNAIPFAPR